MTEVTSDPRVKMAHIRAARLCARGAREYAARHELDWSDFLANGIPASVLEGIGDPFGLRAAEQARLAEGEHNG